MKKVLVLGSGLVASPAVSYLLDHGFQVTVASAIVDQAEALVKDHEHGRAVFVDASDEAALGELVAAHDLAFSLLPATMHILVAELCLKHGKPMVMASYVSPEMRSLDAKARDKGLLFLNEIGLDPGIDHMSAMEIIHRVRKDGGKVRKFASSCGGLPAPEANNNPLEYKFSWSPIGVLRAGLSQARYLKNHQVINIAGPRLFDYSWQVEVGTLGEFTIYPNRDSSIYKELYGLADASNVFRGTIRYNSWCRAMRWLKLIGLLDQNPMDVEGMTWHQYLRTFLIGASDTRSMIAAFVGDADHPIIEWLDYLGFMDDEPMPFTRIPPIEIMAHRMNERMEYAEGERDMIILRHHFEVEYPDRKEDILSQMVGYGIPGGDSIMSRTVGLPAAIAVRLILEDRISLTGVRIPIDPEIYKPVLEELAEMGIGFEETITPL